MKVSFSWLNNYFDKPLNIESLEYDLTMAGLEVDSIEHLGASLDNVVVGKIISIEKHPDADKLNVCQVDVGSKELQIVCGASNARAGIKIPCALIGAKFGQFEIKKAKLRGVESFGMLCSSKEIGLSDSADGLLELSQDLNLGDRISDALDLNDSVLDISLTPNRADCLSVQGIAREIKSLTGNPFHLPKIQKIESNFKSDQKVNVIDSNNCPLYCGVEIAGLNNTINLPKELISYLSRSDISSINPVVDLVNYVMLETGQPMHAFAKDKLTGSIDVRPSKTGEKIVLLNDQEVTLKENDLVIADEKNVLAIAGVMGGKNSSVDYDTKNIFIESAFFTPLSMAGKARNYGLNTDSSHRFERGVDFANSQNALMRLINLIQQYCGGDVSDIQEHKATLPQRSLIKVRPSRVERILGTKVSIEQMESIFTNLGFEFKNSGSEFEVYPPSYRFDLTIEEDLIEEVIRIIGYDNVEAKDPITTLSPLSTNFATYSLDEVRNKISHLGFNELVSYSFIDAEKERDIHFNIDEQIILENPIAENMNAMRSHLWSSHLDALKFNINRGQDRIKFFEIAKSFTKNDESFTEQLLLSGLIYGDSIERGWADKRRKFDFYDLKSDIESIVDYKLIFKVPDLTTNFYHPGQEAFIYKDSEVIGSLGLLHPSIQKKFDIDGNVYLFELDALKILDKKLKLNTAKLKTVPVKRDISILVDQEVQVGEIISAVEKANISNVTSFSLFDLYQGDGIDDSKKSLAFLILIQDTYKTLEENEVENSVQSIINLLKKEFNATQR